MGVRNPLVRARSLAAGITAALVLSVAPVVPAQAQTTTTEPGTAPGREANFTAAATLDLVGRQATWREVDLAVDRLDRGWPRYDIARDLTRGAEWAGGVVDDLYELVLDRSPDATGRAYWTGRLGRGEGLTRDIAALLFSSPEFANRTGNTTSGYVTGVYDRVLGRDPEAGGHDYWVNRIERGGDPRAVSLLVFTSVEANGQRVDALYDHLLSRAPDAGGRTYWAQRLVTIDDLDLAAQLVGSEEYLRRAQLRSDLNPTLAPAGTAWEVTSPEAQGMDGDLLDASREYAFTDGRHTQGVVVVRHGKLVSEWYAEGRGSNSWGASWSVAKSLTSTLVGIAIDEGKIPSIDVAMHTYYPEWRGTERGSITLRHVLEMASGLEFSESYAPTSYDTSDIIQMVVFQLDQLAYAASRPLTHQPGTVFSYSSGDTMLLAGVIEKATGMPADEYARIKLFEPLGMEKVEWWRDAAGQTLGYCCFDTTSRGYARFGQLFLQDGEWNGEQLVPAEWVQASTTPSTSYDGYGLQWWLNTDPSLPDDMFSARGHDGQFIHVIPSLELVVVRNGIYDKYWGEPVADPNLFGHYPPQGLGDGLGTKTPGSWDNTEFLLPIIESIQD